MPSKLTPHLTLTPTLARRIAITAQRLAGPRPAPDAAGLLETARALGCIQLDPISAVDRTHRLVLWSRVGAFDQAALDQVTWHDRSLFEYWAHCASLVLTEHYPIHQHLMRRYRGSGAELSERTRSWVRDNDALRRYILRRLKREGPLLSRQLEENGIHPKAWVSTGWTSGRNVSRMLDFLLMQGTIMVAGRSGGQKLYDLAERCLPEWTPRERLTEREVVRRSAEQSLRALGVATPRQIQLHFTRYRYPNLERALADLGRAGRCRRVEIRDGGAAWKGEWFLHADYLAQLDRMAGDDWAEAGGEPTRLLSPFDNLIADRARTRQLFDFDYTIEIYTPKHRRRFGYYVLPILHGDRLVGRIDPLMNRVEGRLDVNAVYAEPGAPAGAAPAIAAALSDLAGFLGAREIAVSRRQVPPAWKRLAHGLS